MGIRRLVLDVDKAVSRPHIVEIAAAIVNLPGVDAVNITVNAIDIQTVDMNVVIEGSDIDYPAVVSAIESTGAVVNSVDQVVSGNRIVDNIPRCR